MKNESIHERTLESDFLRLLEMPPREISPFCIMIVGRIPSLSPAITASLPILPFLIRYSKEPTVKKILPEPLIFSNSFTVSSKDMPASLSLTASFTNNAWLAVLSVESMMAI